MWLFEGFEKMALQGESSGVEAEWLDRKGFGVGSALGMQRQVMCYLCRRILWQSTYSSVRIFSLKKPDLNSFHIVMES